MKDIIKKTREEKRFKRNSYSLSDKHFRIMWFGCIAILIASLTELFLSNIDKKNYFVLFVIIAALIFTVEMLVSQKGKKDITPYSRQKEYNFIGLHDLTKESLDIESRDVISRNEEVHCIENMLENVIFPQHDIKQAVCITGKSGCGKSTILAFFQQQHKDDYNIYNFSGDYNSLRASLEEKFKTYNVDWEIKKIVDNGKKIVFIFDQFERYFFLSSERQLDIRNFISSLCMKNTAIIVSMREEFLAEFLREFDLNDIKSNYKTNDEVEHTGLLRRLVGYIKDSDNYVTIQGSRRRITFSKWKNEHIKNPEFLHVSDPEGKRVIIEKTDATIFYCENQNNTKTVAGGKESTSSMLLQKCIAISDDFGESLYSRYHNRPLIEQQIIYHMAEFDSKERGVNVSFEEFCNMDTQDIIKRYFDIQLCSTGDYFNASRTSSRLHQLPMKTREIIIGLHSKQFSKNGDKKAMNVINELEKLQLIKKNSNNSTSEYEIAHDYIATAFLNYSRANLDRNVKVALDIFLADFISQYEKNLATKERLQGDARAQNHTNTSPQNLQLRIQDPFEAQNKDRYYKIVTIIFSIIILLTDIVYRFIWNPWEELPLANPMEGILPLFMPIHILICMIYFYQIYDKIFKYYSGKNAKFIRTEYLFMGLIASMSELCYPYFIISDGLGLVMIGATATLMLGREYRETSKSAMSSYGIKCVVMGFAFTLAHVMFCLSQEVFPTYILVLETTAISLLVGYAHFSHMTKEYLYGRCMDVSGKKVNLNHTSK